MVDEGVSEFVLASCWCGQVAYSIGDLILKSRVDRYFRYADGSMQ